MLNILMVGLGGFLGSICRYLVIDLSQKANPNAFLPYGTLIVNVAGCLIIGFLYGMSETRQLFSPEIRMLVFIGFLGGFTTYSTFGYEIFAIIKNGQFLAAGIHLFLHLTLGLGAVWFGYFMSQQIIH